MTITIIIFGFYVCLSVLSTLLILSALAISGKNSRQEERTAQEMVRVWEPEFQLADKLRSETAPAS